jgi:tetratricopeptide (TPR) repeat protein
MMASRMSITDALRRGRGMWLAASLALFSTACATTGVRSEAHEDGWLLVETEHIALRTDLDEEDALERAKQLEQYWQALARMYEVFAPGAPAPRGRLSVIHFDSCRDFARISDAGGFVFPSPDVQERIAVTCETRPDSTLLHELAHIFNHHHFPALPTWLNEGLATYYSSLTVKEGEAVIGSIPPGMRPYWNRPAWLPGLDEIRRMSYEQFHEEESEGRNYFAAWKLVHLLSAGADRRARFRRYLAALSSAFESELAWAQAFGDLSAAELARDYGRYHLRPSVDGWGSRFQWAEPGRPRVRELQPAEAHLLWAILLATSDKRNGAAEQLDRLAAVEPDWPELIYWRALLLRPPDSIRLLRDYVKRRPEDGRGWKELVSRELGRILPPRYLGLGGTPPPGLAAMEGDVRKLIEHSSDATSLNTIGWYFAMRKNPNAGLNFALRAVRAEPLCGPCWDTLGLLYYQAGNVGKALEVQERAVSLYAESAPVDVRTRLRLFRQAATN